MNDRRGLTILLVSVCVSYIACAGHRASQTPEGHTTLRAASLRLKWVFDPGFAGELVAAKQKLFEKHGLDLTIRPGGFDADPVRLVASGADTFGVAGADVFLMARQKGVPIVAFAAGYLQTPVTFYVNPSTGISSPFGFVGHRVGYQAGQDTATVFDALTRKLGIDEHQIKLVPVKFDFTPFLTKHIAVWPGYAATQSYILQREHVPYTTIVPGTYGLAHLGTVYFTTKKVISQDPSLVQAFVDGLIEGWESTYSHQSAAITAISLFDPTSLTPDLVAFNLRTQKPFILPEGRRYCEFTQRDWTAIAATLRTLDMLEQSTNVGDAVNFSFLTKHYSLH
jgi:NitT/TauT family transport system substrate-binding protein